MQLPSRCTTSEPPIAQPFTLNQVLHVLCVCLCVCSSLPRRSFTSLAAVFLAWGWNCRPCSQPSSHRSARRCSEASWRTLLTCWLQPTASSMCSTKRPPSEYPAAQKGGSIWSSLYLAVMQKPPPQKSLKMQRSIKTLQNCRVSTEVYWHFHPKVREECCTQNRQDWFTVKVDFLLLLNKANPNPN